MNRKTIIIVATGFLIIAPVVYWFTVEKIKSDTDKIRNVQQVQESLNNLSTIDTIKPIGTTLAALFSDLSFAISKQRFELFDAKDVLRNQASLQVDCRLNQDIINFKLKLDKLFKLHHLRQEDCTGQLNTVLNNLFYLKKASWTFRDPSAIDSVLSELNGLTSALPHLQLEVLDCSQ